MWFTVESDLEPGLLDKVLGLVEQQGTIPEFLVMARTEAGLSAALKLPEWDEPRKSLLTRRVEGMVGVRSAGFS